MSCGWCPQIHKATPSSTGRSFSTIRREHLYHNVIALVYNVHHIHIARGPKKNSTRRNLLILPPVCVSSSLQADPSTPASLLPPSTPSATTKAPHEILATIGVCRPAGHGDEDTIITTINHQHVGYNRLTPASSTLAATAMHLEAVEKPNICDAEMVNSVSVDAALVIGSDAASGHEVGVNGGAERVSSLAQYVRWAILGQIGNDILQMHTQLLVADSGIRSDAPWRNIKIICLIHYATPQTTQQYIRVLFRCIRVRVFVSVSVA